MPEGDAPSKPGDRRVCVVGDGALAAGLAAALGPGDNTRLLTTRDLDASFADAVASMDGVDLVVCAHFDPAALTERPLVQVDEVEWAAATRGTLDVARRLTVLASVPLHATRGQLVFVLPTVSMTGASGWVPLATAAEALRSWAKSVARQWAAAGVGVNCVATALPVVLGDGSTDPVPTLIGVGFTAGIEPGPADLVAALDALSGPLSQRLVGATLTVDGGVHMEP